MRSVMLALVLLVLFAMGSASFTTAEAATPSLVRSDYQLLAKPGEKIALDAKHYFTYGFSKQPKLGTAVMRVEIFSRDGAPDTTYAVIGDADMPSMRGAHSSGDQNFALSAKGVYLLPVRLVMPGDWEVRFTFQKEGKPVFRGVYLFDL